MIGYLKGSLVSKGIGDVVIDVNGIGYEISVPMTTLFKLPELNSQVQLRTHLSIREDAHVLFGFYDELDRSVFRQLIKVNGVGPKMALAILSGMECHELVHVVQSEDLNSLVKIPGVGKKTAERLIIELRDRLKDLGHTNVPSMAQTNVIANVKQDAESALIALGYKPADASRMIQAVYESGLSSDTLLRNALKSMVTM